MKPMSVVPACMLPEVLSLRGSFGVVTKDHRGFDGPEQSLRHNKYLI
jgi:hypothetical protein